MKHARKLASLLLALVMVFALATTAFAAGDTSTITAPAGSTRTYEVYQIFTGNLDPESKVLSVTVRDISWGYELPNTGGAGTTSYTARGLALIFGAATLLYSHCRRRKEDEASS